MLLLNYAIEARLNRRVMPGDHMHSESNPTHYFAVGASAMHCIAAAAVASGREKDFDEILDFACGSGRVTRWLRAACPNARVTASDLRSDSLEWLAANLGAEPWPSSEEIALLKPSRAFDLVWCGSLLTHLSENAAVGALAAFARWLAPGGLAVVSTHGRRTLENQRAGRQRYLPDNLFEQTACAYEIKGYGYADYPGRRGIGFSVCSPAWLARTVLATVGVRLVALTEAAWDGHHDIVAFQRTHAQGVKFLP